MYDVPRIGEPFALRGTRDVAVVLDEFTPTHLDAWHGRALVAPSALPSPPGGSAGDVPARVLVVRHAGDVAGRRPAFGRRRARLDALLDLRPPPGPLLGIVVEREGPTLLWLPDRDAALLARELSRAEWRTFL